MQYMGGKKRLAKHIAVWIERLRQDRPYLEPFVGGGHILELVPGISGVDRFASDGNKALITLYRAVQSGWDPPDTLTKEQWTELRDLDDPTDPMTAFAGIGCSFMGMWFASPAPQLAGRTRRTLLRQKPLFDGVEFIACPYTAYLPSGCLIYCDPPYANTEGYPGSDYDFDHGEFWRTVERWGKHNTVLISEYTAPPGTQIVEEWELRGRMKQGGVAVDRLFLVGQT